MSIEKTIEEKWLAVKEFLLDKMKEDDDVSWHDQHGVWQAGWWKPNWKLTVRLVDHRISETLLMEQDAVSQSANIPVLYALFGLAERDAVAKEREIAEEYLARLKAERARNTALVEALDQIKKQYGLEHGVLRGERPVINSLGEFINEVLEANTEKGGSDAA